MAGVAGQPEPEDPYRVLGLDQGASPAEVTRAFRRLARVRHPDVHGGAPEAEQEYRRIRRAYELLRDPARRAAYDTRGRTQQRAREATRGRRIPVKVVSHTPRRGGDVAARVRVTLAEAVYGTTCHVPGGAAGAAGNAGQPGTAGNAGQPGAARPPAAVRIPPGTVSGTRLRLRGHGDPGQHGGPPGDLLVTVEVAEHPRFRQHGRDLLTELTTGYPELVLGADVPVETLDGRTVTVHVPPGTTPGARLRVSGLGVPATGYAAAGDLVAEIRLHVPAELSAPAREALTALSEALPPPRGNARQRERSPSGGDLAE